MPSIDGGPQEDPHWNDPVEPVKHAIKFDFEHIDVDLYLALRELYGEMNSGWQSGDWGQPCKETLTMLSKAESALQQFELNRGPLPDWAVNWNFKRELVPGAQLMTKDGRRMGNAHIVSSESKAYPHLANKQNPYGEVTVYHCLTDAGSHFVLNEEELRGSFWVGEFISTPDRIIADFDRHGYFAKEPD